LTGKRYGKEEKWKEKGQHLKRQRRGCMRVNNGIAGNRRNITFLAGGIWD
jgi:hypothetical protein